MWKCYYANQTSFLTWGYYIDGARVLSIQKIAAGKFIKKDLFRLRFYDIAGRYIDKAYEENFEVAKLKGLVKLKDLGFKIKTLNTVIEE